MLTLAETCLYIVALPFLVLRFGDCPWEGCSPLLFAAFGCLTAVLASRRRRFMASPAGCSRNGIKKAPSRNRTKPAPSFHHLLHRTYPSGLPGSCTILARGAWLRLAALRGNHLSEMIRFPITGERRAELLAREPGSRLLSCLLGSDLHCPLTCAGLPPSPARWGFPGTATLFVMAFAVCDVFLIYHYNLGVFYLSSRIRVFREGIFCGFLLPFPETGCRHTADML